ncbi:translation initiation factor IF-2 [Candidatus Saccharibacteria bacterium RIFCSPHIGHO2_02_FULL_47_12]|nr:MAG: translation initiation factor IF-2 [Candidatus Saccharibacteria bacterium RIFCSPHIGHO2_02_FULL_47_12]
MSTRTIEIEDMATVGTLAEKLDLPVSQLITELMKNGVMATVNERVDFDTAQIIVSELNLDVELKKQVSEPSASKREKRKVHESGDTRPPVVAMMGHVDHGKTSLLDVIHGKEVTKTESGGITQHITAYQIVHNKRPITFLDTPGHAAFAAIREHGALLTDLVVIVVAADDGVKPQTVEAIRFAKKAGVKIIVAVNKVDKPEADVNRVKQQLADHEVLVEGWGGDTVVVEVSAKAKQGIDNLLDMILLLADVEELKAPKSGPAAGLIIESHMVTGRGSVAVVLVEEGTLKKGDFVVAGSSYAKIRNLETPDGDVLTEAGPSTPVVITGFKSLPEFGDEFKQVKDEKVARSQTTEAQNAQQASSSRQNLGSSELLHMMKRIQELAELNVIVKADVQGSLTSVIDSLKSLGTDEIAVRVVGSGIGAVSESDEHMAQTSGAIVYAFRVPIPVGTKRLAARDHVSIRHYDVIYELLDDAKAGMSLLLSPEIKETELGRLIVRGIFKLTKTEVICGGEVTKGKLSLPAQARIMRDKEQVAEVEVVALKRGPTDVTEVNEGEMCGLSFHSSARVDLQEGDHVELFRRETLQRSL